MEARYLAYNEPEDGPQMRLQLEFEPDGHATLLLNDSPAAEFLRGLDLRGRFQEAEVEGVRCLRWDGACAGAGASACASACASADSDAASAPLSSFVLATNGSSLIIPLADIKRSPQYTAGGLFITGKQYLRRPIRRSFLLPKNTPTEFVADKFGDSWNDSFFKEPRIIESSPGTVFCAIDGIMAIAKTLFGRGDHSNAAKKYRKAFHYGHSYFPEDLQPADLARLANSKVTALLNLALCYLRLGQNKEVISTAEYALQIPEITNLQRAKAYLRKGSALANLQDEEQALELLSQAQQLNPDKVILQEIERCNLMRSRRRAAVAERMRGAFAAPR